MKKKIGVDCDGVVIDFAKHYAKLYNERFMHQRPAITKEQILQNWDVSKSIGYNEKLWKEQGFFLDMPLIMGAKEGFEWLYENCDTVFVTTVPFNNCAERASHLMKTWPKLRDWDIIFTNRKELVDVDYLIEDAPHNILCRSPENVIIFDQPYNRHIKGYMRVYNWAEIVALAKNDFDFAKFKEEMKK